MRRLRRPSVIVTLVLLTSAATAYAECAWVAWQHVMTTNPIAPATGDWITAASYQAKGEREPFARRMTEEMKNQPPDRSGHKYLVAYVCLPDTVDPPAPKGK